MSLQCVVGLNYNSYAAGMNPPPMATVSVYNPNAAAVVVTSIQMKAYVQNNQTQSALAMSPSVPPIGPGQTTTVPALGTINIGPFPIVVASAANDNPFQMVNQTGNLNPVNPQGSQPPQYTLIIGADVYGSDGSFNTAGVTGLLVSYPNSTPATYQGGVYQFYLPNNFIGIFPGWP